MDEFSRQFELRWSDADANGHVRHTVYAELGVEIRMAFLASGGFRWKELERMGIGPVLLREELDYLRELSLGDRVRVDLEVTASSPDGAKWRMRHRVFDPAGELAARVTVAFGWLDLAARRLAVPADPFVAHLRTAPRAADHEELPPLKRRG
jgi:acyl-CoA thioester hydrolase